MANSHIKTAFDMGVREALKELGYSSSEEVQKHAEELGLVEAPKQEKIAAPVAAALAKLNLKK